MLGDTAVAVHPEDDRYRHLVGKTVYRPFPKAPITIMGHVSINFVVKTAYCTEPILVTVKPK